MLAVANKSRRCVQNGTYSRSTHFLYGTRVLMACTASRQHQQRAPPENRGQGLAEVRGVAATLSKQPSEISVPGVLEATAGFESRQPQGPRCFQPRPDTTIACFPVEKKTTDT